MLSRRGEESVLDEFSWAVLLLDCQREMVPHRQDKHLCPLRYEVSASRSDLERDLEDLSKIQDTLNCEIEQASEGALAVQNLPPGPCPWQEDCFAHSDRLAFAIGPSPNPLARPWRYTLDKSHAIALQRAMPGVGLDRPGEFVSVSYPRRSIFVSLDLDLSYFMKPRPRTHLPEISAEAARLATLRNNQFLTHDFAEMTDYYLTLNTGRGVQGTGYYFSQQFLDDEVAPFSAVANVDGHELRLRPSEAPTREWLVHLDRFSSALDYDDYLYREFAFRRDEFLEAQEALTARVVGDISPDSAQVDFDPDKYAARVQFAPETSHDAVRLFVSDVRAALEEMKIPEVEIQERLEVDRQSRWVAFFDFRWAAIDKSTPIRFLLEVESAGPADALISIDDGANGVPLLSKREVAGIPNVPLLVGHQPGVLESIENPDRVVVSGELELPAALRRAWAEVGRQLQAADS